MNTQQVLEQLRRYESPNVTYIAEDGSWPIVWKSARGAFVVDLDGKRYLDLTAAFGVAAAGHCNAAVVRAGQRQLATLLHAMGDVHPHALKAQLAQKLSDLTFGRWSNTTNSPAEGRVIFCNSGFEAVEAALKTAILATGKTHVVAFEGAYHGLGYGALNATHRAHFRNPFRPQMREFCSFAPFPTTDSSPEQGPDAVLDQVHDLLQSGNNGAVIIEPIQARGGIRVPPQGFLPELRRLCDSTGALLIFDEIYTGFGRTGNWFACEHEHVAPDLICLGKALTGGFPLSACVGRSDLMVEAWPRSEGEAIHTSTFLGHPVGCAMALANVDVIAKLSLPERAGTLGNYLLRELRALFVSGAQGLSLNVRGRGLMVGVELLKHGKPCTELCLALVARLLKAGYIFLPEGEHANVLGFTPPLIITQSQLKRAARAAAAELRALLG